METRKMAAEYRLAQWSGRIQARVMSGQSIKDFCESECISRNTYFYWQRKLRETACEQLVSAKMQTNGFTQVQLAAANEPATQVIGQVRLQLGEIDITADSAYPADKLAALVRGLVQSC